MLLGYYTGHAGMLALGVMHPVYRSYKSLKCKTAEEQWLPYWIIFALYSSVEVLLNIIFASWCPFYYELKLAFVLVRHAARRAYAYACLPTMPLAFFLRFHHACVLLFSQWLQPRWAPCSWDGAAVVYDKYLGPFLDAKAPMIDEYSNDALVKAKNMNVDDLSKLVDWVSKMAGKGETVATTAEGKATTAESKVVKGDAPMPGVVEQPEKPSSPSLEDTEIIEAEPDSEEESRKDK